MSQIPDRDQTRLEFPCLIRFKNHWYCAFREGEIHNAHPSGRGRIIRSADGQSWHTVALLTWDGGDVRELKFSITAEGHLMANTGITFVSREPRADGAFYQLDDGNLMKYRSDDEPGVMMQSATWLSADGENWGSAYACPTGANTWRWDTTWHNGMGYSVGQCGKDAKGTLYRTRDGKSWRPLLHPFYPDTGGNEGALAFGPDGTAYCLLRDGKPRPTQALDAQDVVRHSDGHHIDARHNHRVHGTHVPLLGIGTGPYYQQWRWDDLRVDYGPAHGGVGPSHELFRAPLGGPKLLYLSDGRLLAAGRMLGPGRDDGHATLFWVDPNAAVLTIFCEFNGTSYPGVVEHEGSLWVTFSAPDASQVRLAKVSIPD